MQDYTIDYEEYYNRQMVWCVWNSHTGSNFKWNIWMSGYCTEFTAYGNENTIDRVGSRFNDIYYCTSKTPGTNKNVPTVKQQSSCWKIWSRQAFGQYAALFIDVWWDTDRDNNFLWDSDDRNLWYTLIPAIVDADNIQELYLISNDGKSRIFFRRKFVWTWWDNWEYALYKLQMLRLRWFDAGQQHNFNTITGNVWLYDWKIDTWACDYWMWFEWKWASVSWAYSSFKLPKDVDDCWVDVTQGSTTVLSRSMKISPLTDPELSRAKGDRQINPYIQILTVNGIYAPFYKWRMADSIIDFKIPLRTTINTKSFYTK